MKKSDFKAGNFYKIRGYCGYAEALELISPLRIPNKSRSFVVKCRWIQDKENVDSINYFKLADLIPC